MGKTFGWLLSMKKGDDSEHNEVTNHSRHVDPMNLFIKDVSAQHHLIQNSNTNGVGCKQISWSDDCHKSALFKTDQFLIKNYCESFTSR